MPLKQKFIIKWLISVPQKKKNSFQPKLQTQFLIERKVERWTNLRRYNRNKNKILQSGIIRIITIYKNLNSINSV